MKAEHFEVLVEEPSMEAFLTEFLPKFIGDRATFRVYVHQGKSDLLNKLEARLRGYSKWLPENFRIIVLVDCDDDDCVVLKERLEKACAVAGLSTRANRKTPIWQVANRICIEELEAWFFGEWAGVRRAYPKVSGTVNNKISYRHCDSIQGGTWEAFERVLKLGGYFSGGLRKVEAARKIGKQFNHETCVSPSFKVFRDVIIEAME